MTTGIYGIFCTANSKVYVGYAQDIEFRWQRHCSGLRNNRHRNSHLQHAWNKYGPGCFLFEVLEECLLGDPDNREEYWIAFLNTLGNGFNLTSGGKAGRHTEEVRRKISQAQIGERNHRWGKKHTDEWRTNHSLALTGKKHTEETKRKIGAAQKGKIVSEETRAKMREAWERRKGIRINKE